MTERHHEEFEAEAIAALRSDVLPSKSAARDRVRRRLAESIAPASRPEGRPMPSLAVRPYGRRRAAIVGPPVALAVAFAVGGGAGAAVAVYSMHKRPPAPEIVYVEAPSSATPAVPKPRARMATSRGRNLAEAPIDPRTEAAFELRTEEAAEPMRREMLEPGAQDPPVASALGAQDPPVASALGAQDPPVPPPRGKSALGGRNVVPAPSVDETSAPVAVGSSFRKTLPAHASAIVADPLGMETLASQQALLDEARRAFGTGDYPTTLRDIDSHAQRFPHSLLSEEREALAIKALAALGRGDEAKRRGATFQARFPRSLLRSSVDDVLRAIP